MYESIIIAQVLLLVVVGLWLGAKFKNSPTILFFGRNDWFVGCFLILVGYMDYAAYVTSPVRNVNILLMVLGLILLIFSVIDIAKS